MTTLTWKIICHVVWIFGVLAVRFAFIAAVLILSYRAIR